MTPSVKYLSVGHTYGMKTLIWIRENESIFVNSNPKGEAIRVIRVLPDCFVPPFGKGIKYCDFNMISMITMIYE
jgi:hypothetical protein